MSEKPITNPEIKELVDKRPYVVSGDIKILLQPWAQKTNLLLPDNQFFSLLRNDFNLFTKGIFPGYEFIPEEELSIGLRDLVESSGFYPLSLDRVYFPANLRIDIARQVDSNGQDKGLGRRADSPLLLEQFRSLKRLGIDEIALIDDVIFSGGLILRVGKA